MSGSPQEAAVTPGPTASVPTDGQPSMSTEGLPPSAEVELTGTPTDTPYAEPLSGSAPSGHPPTANPRERPVAEAAEILRMHVDSLRRHVRKGTRQGRHDEQGRLFVTLTQGELAAAAAPAPPRERPTGNPLLQEVERLQRELEKERELRAQEQDHIATLKTALEGTTRALHQQQVLHAHVAGVPLTEGDTPRAIDAPNPKRRWWRR